MQMTNRIREYFKIKYAGDCKCGNCHLVPTEVLESWRQSFEDLAVAADTAELMLRKEYPAAAQSLRAKVSIAKALTSVQS